jgi:hypothetical protein
MKGHTAFCLLISTIQPIWLGADAAHGGPQLSFPGLGPLADHRPRDLPQETERPVGLAWRPAAIGSLTHFRRLLTTCEPLAL